MLNKKSNWVLIGIMSFIVVLIAIVQFIPVVKDQIVTTRSDLDCANESITTGTKMTCIAVDTTLFYFVGVAIVAGAGYLWGKRVKFKPPE